MLCSQIASVNIDLTLNLQPEAVWISGDIINQQQQGGGVLNREDDGRIFFGGHTIDSRLRFAWTDIVNGISEEGTVSSNVVKKVRINYSLLQDTSHVASLNATFSFLRLRIHSVIMEKKTSFTQKSFSKRQHHSTLRSRFLQSASVKWF